MTRKIMKFNKINPFSHAPRVAALGTRAVINDIKKTWTAVKNVEVGPLEYAAFSLPLFLLMGALKGGKWLLDKAAHSKFGASIGGDSYLKGSAWAHKTMGIKEARA